MDRFSKAVLGGLVATAAVVGWGETAVGGNEPAAVTAGSSSKRGFLDVRKVTSPVIFHGNAKHAYRDPAAVYHEGKIYLYFTLGEAAEDGGYYVRTAMSTSDDLLNWSKPKALTPRDRRLNYSSPGNVVRFGGQWVLCLQSYPTPNKETFGNADSRLFIMRSKNLVDWSEPELLAVKGPDVPVEKMGRMIDPYLLQDADTPGRWWCFYKQKGVSISFSDDLKNWTYVGRAPAGENVTVIRQNNEYVMFHSPRNGIGVKRSRRPDRWGKDVQLLTLGQKDWPWAAQRLTAATVLDLTREPGVGKYLMFFHGDQKSKLPAHRRASLAVAWSDDLQTWDWPGKQAPDEKPAPGAK
ncbi:MAG: hypothetical protein JW818_15015 [Pirellulales bacterium]|nr:hypothetical protein [Pirellulales bacterium]